MKAGQKGRVLGSRGRESREREQEGTPVMVAGMGLPGSPVGACGWGERGRKRKPKRT